METAMREARGEEEHFEVAHILILFIIIRRLL